MPYDQIDATKIQVFPLAERLSYIQIEKDAWNPRAAAPEAGAIAGQLELLTERIARARGRGAAVMLTYGAHLIKNGGGPLLVALMEGGWVTHLATQGAGVIHDWEFAYLGRSSESVRDNAPAGKFGTWDETGRWINLAVLVGATEGMGFGESVGKLIEREELVVPAKQTLRGLIAEEPSHELTGARADLLGVMERLGVDAGTYRVPHPWKRYSALAAAYRLRVPFTVHCGIGYDIIANHPLYHGGAIGRGSGTDLRIFAQSVMNLTGGVYLSVGSAIMSPQVFEKAFSVVNNLRLAKGEATIQDHTIAVVDLQDGGNWNWNHGEPPKSSPAYYLRYCKSFYRMGGDLQYVQGDNCVVLSNLIARLGGR